MVTKKKKLVRPATEDKLSLLRAELMNPDFWRQIGDMGQNWDSFGTVTFWLFQELKCFRN